MSEWEVIDQRPRDSTERMAIPGGWLYRTIIRGWNESAVALVFVPEVKATASMNLAPDEQTVPVYAQRPNKPKTIELIGRVSLTTFEPSEVAEELGIYPENVISAKRHIRLGELRWDLVTI